MAAKKKAKKAKKPVKGTKSKADSSGDRKRGKELGLGLIHFRVLDALDKCTTPDVTSGLSYRQIEEKTGYFSVLAGIMHTDAENGLVPKGLAKDTKQEVNGRDVLTFCISAKGHKLLQRKIPVKSANPTKKKPAKKPAKKKPATAKAETATSG